MKEIRFFTVNDLTPGRHPIYVLSITPTTDVGEAYDEAYSRFEAIYGMDPHRISCDCCGRDFSFFSHESLQDAMDTIRDFTKGRETTRPIYDEDGQEYTWLKLLDMQNRMR